jgi:3'-phosphoadenosine 5'-phosphosulfate sulfotransferase (PAPS reductase)/FAD synthetase
MTSQPSASTTMAVASYGGGVQSTALLVLAAQRRLDLPVFLLANTGDDSEHPQTLHYVRNIAVPYAQAHGIALHELHRTRRDGSVETLDGRPTRPGSRSLPIPVRMSSGAPGTRTCCVICTIAPR